LFLFVVAVLLALGYYISTKHLYRPGDDVGYNMGLVGGVIMLLLLLYPLRKRVAIFKNLGAIPTWFSLHMIFGILAPVLIVFHTAFTMRSVNATIALISMLLVSGSGIFGRFFYTKIHNGLYGRQTNLKELQDDMAVAGNENSILGLSPVIEKQLNEFSARTFAVSNSSDVGLIHFATIGVRAALLSHKLSRELHHVVFSKSGEKKLSAEQLYRQQQIFQQDKRHINFYIQAVRDVAQFHTYERMFSWWHILHIPMVYLLTFSAIFHVVSVHMY